MFWSAYLQADLFGKIIFILLLTLSLLSWGVLIYKIWQAYAVKKAASTFSTRYRQFRHNPLNVDYISTSDTVPDCLFQMYRHLKDHTVEVLKKNRANSKQESVYLSSSDLDLLDTHLGTIVSDQKLLLEKHLYLLSLTATLAPLVGLLGTVWGILVTFNELQGAAGAQNQLVLGGLSTALTTTVIGLLIAIPARIAYYTLKNQLNAFTIKMEDFGSEMLIALEMNYRKVEGAS